MLVAYVRLCQVLDEHGRLNLREEQTRWHKLAAEEADAAGREYEGGTLQSYLASVTYARLAQRRTAELMARLPSE
jgi:uncharacterized protein YecT (DUF1311 family)